MRIQLGLILCLTISSAQATEIKTEQGIASVYGNLDGQQYQKTANGERVYPHLGTCAHRTAPFNTIISITNISNKKTATCRVNDRGPFKARRIIDVMPAVASQLGFEDTLAKVTITYALRQKVM